MRRLVLVLTALVVPLVSLAQQGPITHLYENIVSQLTSSSGYGMPYRYYASTAPQGTFGDIDQAGVTPANWGSGGFSASVYQTTSVQFACTTAHGVAPPTEIYLTYAGSIASLTAEPAPVYPNKTRTFAFSGSATTGSLTFPLSCDMAWNATARYGVVLSGAPFENATGEPDPVIDIPSSQFDGWTYEGTNGIVDAYKSVGTYTITTPDANDGAVMGALMSFSNFSNWSYAMWWSFSG